MKFYKVVDGQTILYIGKSHLIPEDAIEIDEPLYVALEKKIANPPEDTLESVHFLSSDSGEYRTRPRTEDEKLAWYIHTVLEGAEIITVPEAYREEVEKATVNKNINAQYGIPNEIFERIVDDYTLNLVEGGLLR